MKRFWREAYAIDKAQALAKDRHYDAAAQLSMEVIMSMWERKDDPSGSKEEARLMAEQLAAIVDGCSLGQMCVVELRSDGLYCPRCKSAFATVTMDGQAG